MILITEKSADYELLDSGMGIHGGEKLERFGTYIIARPDPEVLWNKNKSADEWAKAGAHFVTSKTGGTWKKENAVPEEWVVQLCDVKFSLHFGTFKHLGIFPEHNEQWKWMRGRVTKYEVRTASTSGGKEGKKIKILNLFGYTGGASMVLSKAGADVTHVDASESAVSWAKENATLNDISNIRFIVDDVRKFVEREIKRGVRYDAIVMDPPVYGKGAKKQSTEKAWHLEQDLLPLLARCKELLSDTPLFFVVSGYASEYSHLSYANALKGIFPHTSDIESGELIIKESDTSRLLPAGIFARVSF